tara:strand:- start:98 stop:910 length:813 start_codon:yes stop_codon:yes gene_type:complete
MAVFGNSTSQQHSILAGYQRRANQMKARSTSKFNTVNLGSIRDSINDGYNRRFTKPYGDTADLQNKVKTWHDYSVNEVKNANDRLAQAEARLGKLEGKRLLLDELHKQIQDILVQLNDGDSTNLNLYGEKIREIKQKVDGNYNVGNYEQVRRYITDEIGRKNIKGTTTRWSDSSQGDWEYAKGSARKDIELAKEDVRRVSKVQESVHLKAVEDFMVDGRLIRESKTALVVTPLTTLLVGGLIAYGVYKLGSGTPINFSGSNKSAAMAVFK